MNNQKSPLNTLDDKTWEKVRVATGKRFSAAVRAGRVQEAVLQAHKEFHAGKARRN